MSARWLLALFVGCALALSAAIGFFLLSTPDQADHERFERSLSARRALDQEIARHVLEARFGFTSNYDQLAKDDLVRRELARESRGKLPAFLRAVERREIEESLERYAELAEERERSVERFKSEHSLLRNSIGYFPNAVGSASAMVRDPNLGVLVASLDDATLRLALNGDARSAALQKSAEHAVRQVLTQVTSDELAHALRLMLTHADAIAVHKDRSEALLNVILSLPVDSVRSEVDARYREAYARAQQDARSAAFAVSGLALLLLASVVYAVRRQRQAAAALERANARLETAVAERTADLEAEMARRARMELELRQAQKLEAVGQLASGIAHEINTPIQYVGDSLYFLRQAFSDVMRLTQAYAHLLTDLRLENGAAANAVRELAEEIDVPALGTEVPAAFERSAEGTRQVASIVRAMKTFAHASVEKAPMDLNAAIRNTLIVARNEYKYVAEVETELGYIPDVVCNASGIRQVLLNLVVNAAHAIADSGCNVERRGAIRISTARRSDDVIVSIADTGTGIPEEIRERIFEPFFTTKEPGRGSGQGLAISRRIVAQHGGKLWFRSEPGRGTAFFIELPIHALENSKSDAEHAA